MDNVTQSTISGRLFQGRFGNATSIDDAFNKQFGSQRLDTGAQAALAGGVVASQAAPGILRTVNPRLARGRYGALLTGGMVLAGAAASAYGFDQLTQTGRDTDIERAVFRRETVDAMAGEARTAADTFKEMLKQMLSRGPIDIQAEILKPEWREGVISLGMSYGTLNERMAIADALLTKWNNDTGEFITEEERKQKAYELSIELARSQVKTMDEIAKMQMKLMNAAAKSARELENLYNRMETWSGIVARTQNIGNREEELQRVREAQASGQTALFSNASSVNPLQNLRAYTEDEIRRFVAGIVQLGGGTEDATIAGDLAITAKLLTDRLPSLVTEIASMNIDERSSFAFEFEKRLRETFAGVPAAVLQSVIDGVSKNINEGDGGARRQSAEQFIQTSQFSQLLTQVGQQGTQAISKFVESFEANKKKFEQAITEYANATKTATAKFVDASMRRLDIEQRYSDVFRQLAGAPVNIDQAMRGTTDRARMFANYGGIDTVSIDRLTSQRSLLQSQWNELQNIKLDKNDIEGIKSVATESVELQKKIDFLTKATEVLANDTSSLSAINSKILEQQQRQQIAEQGIEAIATMPIAEQRKWIRSARQYQDFQNSGGQAIPFMVEDRNRMIAVGKSLQQWQAAIGVSEQELRRQRATVNYGLGVAGSQNMVGRFLGPQFMQALIRQGIRTEPNRDLVNRAEQIMVTQLRASSALASDSNRELSLVNERLVNAVTRLSMQMEGLAGNADLIRANTQVPGPVAKFATGGKVGGYGNRDTVPAMLTPGEYVIKAPVAQKYGALLSGLNSGSIDPAYLAGGGFVSADKTLDWYEKYLRAIGYRASNLIIGIPETLSSVGEGYVNSRLQLPSAIGGGIKGTITGNGILQGAHQGFVNQSNVTGAFSRPIGDFRKWTGNKLYGSDSLEELSMYGIKASDAADLGTGLLVGGVAKSPNSIIRLATQLLLGSSSGESPSSILVDQNNKTQEAINRILSDTATGVNKEVTDAVQEIAQSTQLPSNANRTLTGRASGINQIAKVLGDKANVISGKRVDFDVFRKMTVGQFYTGVDSNRSSGDWMSFRGMTDAFAESSLGRRSMAFDRVQAAIELRKALRDENRDVNPVDLLARNMPLRLDPTTWREIKDVQGSYSYEEANELRRRWASMYVKMLGLSDETYNIDDLNQLVDWYLDKNNISQLRSRESRYQKSVRRSGGRTSRRGLNLLDSINSNQSMRFDDLKRRFGNDFGYIFTNLVNEQGLDFNQNNELFDAIMSGKSLPAWLTPRQASDWRKFYRQYQEYNERQISNRFSPEPRAITRNAAQSGERLTYLDRIFGVKGTRERDAIDKYISGASEQLILRKELSEKEIKEIEDYRRRYREMLERRNNPIYRSSGGRVGNGSMNISGPIDRSFFTPRGTDTVPAMLSEGEYVVRAQVAKKNYSLLDRLNNGGPIYRANGGAISGGYNYGNTILDTGRFETYVNRLSGSFDKFGIASDRFSSSLMSAASDLTRAATMFNELHIPDSISLEATHNVNVSLNGAAVLQSIVPQIQQMIVSEVGRHLPRTRNIENLDGLS